MANSIGILIVEDESIVALDMQNRLRRLGYRVLGRAISGLEAIEQAMTCRPDLILMDIRLQGPIDGIEAATVIRERLSVPIIYLTAYSDNDTLERAKITEPQGYLIKPFEERELQTTIEVALYKYSMEQRLQTQSEQFRTILNTVPEGIVLLDESHCVIAANALGHQYLDDIAIQDVGDQLVSVGEYSLDYFLTTPAEWREIEIDSVPRRILEILVKPTIPDTQNAKPQWVIVIKDVTSNREILQRSQQQSQLAAVGQLAAGIAHDFNNILTILNLGDKMVMMTEKNMSPQNAERLRNNMNQIRRGSELINQMLDFSRCAELEATVIDLTPLVKETSKMLQRMLPETIKFDLEQQQVQCTVRADAVRIQQVLTNLVINARDALPEGGHIIVRLDALTIELGKPALLPDLSPGNWILLQVIDNGHGIPDHVLPHVFEPFFSTKPKGKGVGLGLAQVYGIVRQHEGVIDVISEEGQGTAFSIYLPAYSATTNAVTDANGEGSMINGTHETILLVEDEKILRETLAELLVLLDYKVLQAANGREALALFHQHAAQIQLVLSDMIMPEMGGLDLCHALRRHSAELPIIIMTGYSSDFSLQKLEELNVAAIMRKPMQLEVLTHTIEVLLNGCALTENQLIANS